MANRNFIDTNILIYTLANDNPTKQKLALDLMRKNYEQGSGVLSTQVLQEYCNVTLKKLKLAPAFIRANLNFYEQFDVVQVTPQIIRDAIDIHQTRMVGFYDSIVLVSAITAGCAVLYSEDMNAGQIINGLQIVNPFAI